MNFFFQSGEFTIPESSSFWESLIGALIGAAAALLVYYLETKRERQKDRQLRLEGNRNNLTYFSLLIESIISFGERQSGFYLEHSISLDQNPLEFNLLKTLVVEDLNRAINKFDHERIFHSYLEEFGSEKDRIRTFKKIFSKLDYLYKKYDESNQVQERYLNDLKDRLYKYKELAEEQTISFCSILVNKLKHNLPDYSTDDFYNTLNKAIINYYNNRPKPMPIGYIQEVFINPIKIELVRKFRHIEEANEIADNCRKATWLYNETIFKSRLASQEFKEFHQEFKLATDELKSLTLDLMNKA